MAKCTPSSSRPGMGRSRGARRAGGQKQRVVLFHQLARIDRSGGRRQPALRLVVPVIFGTCRPPHVGVGDKLPRPRRAITSNAAAGPHRACPTSCWEFRTSTTRRCGRPARNTVTRMACLVQLVGRCGKPGGPRADDGDPSCRYAGLPVAWGCHPALGEAAIDDGVFDILDRDRRIGNAQHTSPFTRAPGQVRPVNSGKLLVLCSRSNASRHWSR